MLPFSYALRNLFRDPARLVQTVGGSVLVVVLLIAAVAMNQGMDSVLSTSGSPRNVIILKVTDDNESRWVRVARSLRSNQISDSSTVPGAANNPTISSASSPK